MAFLDTAGLLDLPLPSLIGAPLIAGGGAIWVGVLLAGLSALSVVCTIKIVETKDKTMRASVTDDEQVLVA